MNLSMMYAAIFWFLCDPGKCPLHCGFLFANLLTSGSKMPFLFKMPIQPLRLVLQQKQPHQQLHLNKVSFKLLKGYVSERLRLVQKKILYGSTSFVSFKYTPKLWPELQCSVYWLLSDLCHQLDLKNKPRKSVPSSEWRGGESTEDFVEVDTILCLKCGYLSKIFLGWTIMTNQSNTKH